jgi:hypothetical protein
MLENTEGTIKKMDITNEITETGTFIVFVDFF